MRLDVCVDLSAPLPEVLAAFDKVPQFHSVIGKDKKHQGYAQTYYTDEVQNGLNRSRLVRVYDKMLDSFRKGKTWLFPHLADAPEVRRVELELRPEFCARLGRSPLDLVSDDELLRRVFNSSLADYSTHALKSVPLAKCRRYSTDLRRDFCALGRLPSRYLAQALGYVRKIREASGYP